MDVLSGCVSSSFGFCVIFENRYATPEVTMEVTTEVTMEVNHFLNRIAGVRSHSTEYVIMHELCHMIYHNHSKSFYSLLTRCQPDWRKRKEILDKVVI